MASETFLKISKLTKHMFVLTHDTESKPYVFELIRQVPENCRDLEQHQMLMVYEGIGHMVNVSNQQEVLVGNLMQYANKDWQEIIVLANQNLFTLAMPEVIKRIDFIIKINQRVAESVGPMYVV